MMFCYCRTSEWRSNSSSQLFKLFDFFLLLICGNSRAAAARQPRRTVPGSIQSPRRKQSRPAGEDGVKQVPSVTQRVMGWNKWRAETLLSTDNSNLQLSHTNIFNMKRICFVLAFMIIHWSFHHKKTRYELIIRVISRSINTDNNV